MTPEQKAAFVNARVAMLNAEIAAVKAREYEAGHPIGEHPYREVIAQYDDILHNPLIEFFHRD